MNIITQEDLFAGRFGNGVVIANKRVMEDGDYKNIAHIADNGLIRWYYKPDMDAAAFATIRAWVNAEKKSYYDHFMTMSAESAYSTMYDAMTVADFLDFTHHNVPSKMTRKDMYDAYMYYYAKNNHYIAMV